MNISPVNLSFQGRYYDFQKGRDPRGYCGFKLGMPDKEVTCMSSEGPNYIFPQTAEQIREKYIQCVYPQYTMRLPDKTVIGQRKDSDGGMPYDVTAGQVREEIIKEEIAQKIYEDQKAQNAPVFEIIDDTPDDIRYLRD